MPDSMRESSRECTWHCQRLGLCGGYYHHTGAVLLIEPCGYPSMCQRVLREIQAAHLGETSVHDNQQSAYGRVGKYPLGKVSALNNLRVQVAWFSIGG